MDDMTMERETNHEAGNDAEVRAELPRFRHFPFRPALACISITFLHLQLIYSNERTKHCRL